MPFPRGRPFRGGCKAVSGFLFAGEPMALTANDPNKQLDFDFNEYQGIRSTALKYFKEHPIDWKIVSVDRENCIVWFRNHRGSLVEISPHEQLELQKAQSNTLRVYLGNTDSKREIAELIEDLRLSYMWERFYEEILNRIKSGLSIDEFFVGWERDKPDNNIEDKKGGRPPKNIRLVNEAIRYVLRDKNLKTSVRRDGKIVKTRLDENAVNYYNLKRNKNIPSISNGTIRRHINENFDTLPTDIKNILKKKN